MAGSHQPLGCRRERCLLRWILGAICLGFFSSTTWLNLYSIYTRCKSNIHHVNALAVRTADPANYDHALSPHVLMLSQFLGSSVTPTVELRNLNIPQCRLL